MNVKVAMIRATIQEEERTMFDLECFVKEKSDLFVWAVPSIIRSCCNCIHARNVESKMVDCLKQFECTDYDSWEFSGINCRCSTCAHRNDWSNQLITGVRGYNCPRKIVIDAVADPNSDIEGCIFWKQ